MARSRGFILFFLFCICSSSICLLFSWNCVWHFKASSVLKYLLHLLQQYLIENSSSGRNGVVWIIFKLWSYGTLKMREYKFWRNDGNRTLKIYWSSSLFSSTCCCDLTRSLINANAWSHVSFVKGSNINNVLSLVFSCLRNASWPKL